MEKVLSPALLAYLKMYSPTIGTQFLARRISLLFLQSQSQIIPCRQNHKRKRNPMSNCNSKNEYEIRLNVLQLASNQAESIYYTQLELARLAAGEGKPYELPEDKRTRDTLKIAKKLYAFIQDDGQGEDAAE